MNEYIKLFYKHIKFTASMDPFGNQQDTLVFAAPISLIIKTTSILTRFNVFWELNYGKY